MRRSGSSIIGIVLFGLAGAAWAEPVQVGHTVPDVALDSIDGDERRLSESVTDGSVVLVLYRGVW